MGCWNETCGITQMPIYSGDPVVLVLLTKVDRHTENHGGFCYSNDVWTPKYLPVFGEYDDYGSLENIEENWNTQFIVDQLRQELAQVRLTQPTPKADATYADTRKHFALDLDAFTVNDVLDQIHEDRVWVPGVRDNLPVGWCMMHRWVWDHMIQVMDRDWRENISLETVGAHGEAYYEAMMNRYAEVRAISDDVAMGLLLKHSRRSLVDWENAFAVFSESGSRLDSYLTLSGLRSYDDVLWKLAEAGEPVQDAQVQQVIRALAEMLVFINNMSGLRKFWSPLTGKGSQNSAHQAHLALHELCVVKLRERIKQWEHDYGDDEEEA